MPHWRQSRATSSRSSRHSVDVAALSLDLAPSSHRPFELSTPWWADSLDAGSGVRERWRSWLRDAPARHFDSGTGRESGSNSIEQPVQVFPRARIAQSRSRLRRLRRQRRQRLESMRDSRAGRPVHPRSSRAVATRSLEYAVALECTVTRHLGCGGHETPWPSARPRTGPSRVDSTPRPIHRGRRTVHSARRRFRRR
jgi:hypothetical protein